MTRLLAFATLFAAIAAAAPLTQGERDRAMSHLHSTRKMFLDAVDGLTESQWKFKPAPDRWSVAEVAEHLALSEDRIFALIGKMLSEPAQPGKSADERVKDETILKAIPDRSSRFQAPEMIRPTGRYPDRKATSEAFKQSRDRTIEFIQKSEKELRDHFTAHPVAGNLDAYQWSLLMSAHTDRHVQQMREVMADPAFPKK